jgi:hypothetical protein
MDSVSAVADYFKVPVRFFCTNPNLSQDHALEIINDPNLIDKYMPESEAKDSSSSADMSISKQLVNNTHQSEYYNDTNDDLFIQFVKHLGRRGIIGENQYFVELSRLINILPDDATRIATLKRLVNQFSKDPLLWGHLAIAYRNVKQTQLAIETADFGIKISQPIDVFLYYVMGRCLCSAAYDLIDGVKDHSDLTPDKMARLKYLVEQAGKQFKECREMEATNEDGYIFHLQLIIRVLDFGYRASRKSELSGFLKGEGAQALWYSELLLLAKDLFDELKQLSGTEKESPVVDELFRKWRAFIKDYVK